jgi:hypothetical protein
MDMSRTLTALVLLAGLGLATAALAKDGGGQNEVQKPEGGDGDVVSGGVTPPITNTIGAIGNTATGGSVGAISNANRNVNRASGGSATATGGSVGPVTTTNNSRNSNVNRVSGGAGGAASANNSYSGSYTGSYSGSATATTGSVTGNTSSLSDAYTGEASASGNSTSISTPRQPVATAYAAPLTSGVDTCMGSSSLGGQGVGFGLSIGTTWNDQNCVMLKKSRELFAQGHPAAATALLCRDGDIREAFRLTGEACPQDRVAQAAPAPLAAAARSRSEPDWQGTAYR